MMILVTNNPDVRDKYNDIHDVHFIDGTYRDVLVAVRDLVYANHELLTHPLMGSVKPNETPYRSIAVAKQARELDMQSVMIIEDGIQTFDKFAKVVRPDRGINTPEKLLADFRLIDLTLISGGIDGR